VQVYILVEIITSIRPGNVHANFGISAPLVFEGTPYEADGHTVRDRRARRLLRPNRTKA